MKFRKRPMVVEATQWFKNGGHPEDACVLVVGVGLSEGKVVRYYRRPDDDGKRLCAHCKVRMHDHGWIDTLEGGHVVCPGDWVLTGVKGERYPVKDAIFRETYEQVW